MTNGIQPFPPDPQEFIAAPELIYPTMRQLVLSTIIGIGTHPRIKNPGIYPAFVPGGQEVREVKIQEYRTYGGIELTNPGLTCSVYPLHTPRDSISGSAIESPTADFSQMFKPMTLGANNDATAMDEVTCYLVVELAIQNSSFDEALSFQVTEATSLEMQLSNHAYRQMLSDGRLGMDEEQFISPPFNDQIDQLITSDFNIRVNIGEAILTEYMDLMVLVLNDLPTLRPFRVRSTQVKAVDYSTSNWLNKPQNINFHQAYLLWELTLYRPKSWRDIYFIPVRQIDINGVTVNPGALRSDLICDDRLLVDLISDTAGMQRKKVIQFTQANLTIANILIAKHNLDERYPTSIFLWNNIGEVLQPDQITTIDENTLTIDLSTHAPIAGQWTLIIGVT